MAEILAVLPAVASGFVLPTSSVHGPTRHSDSCMHAPSVASRRDALFGGAAALVLTNWPAGASAEDIPEGAVAPPPPPPAAPKSVTTKSGLAYEVINKGGGGGKPVVGDLIAIRFKGAVAKTGQVFDDILAGEPYYMRVGSGNVLPGVEEAVKLMSSGDMWKLTIPPSLAFGEKGRSASPGKPRIPSGAVIDFTLELVAVPGKDEEILEMNDIQN